MSEDKREFFPEFKNTLRIHDGTILYLEDGKAVTVKDIKEGYNQARREGADRLIKLLNEHSPFVYHTDGTIKVCDHCMEAKKIWEAFEKEDSKGYENTTPPHQIPKDFYK